MFGKTYVKLFVVLFTGISLALCTADSLPAQKKESDSAKPSDKETKATPKKSKGRLPNYYGKLNLTPEQRDKIYKIQADYNPQIDSLKKQLDELNKKRNTEYETILSASQKANLEKLLTEAANKKTAKK
tara:strand:- start:1519 stop:1905 length:387 start_codon:yes stop_codon:yes gene_type:complete